MHTPIGTLNRYKRLGSIRIRFAASAMRGALLADMLTLELWRLVSGPGARKSLNIWPFMAIGTARKRMVWMGYSTKSGRALPYFRHAGDALPSVSKERGCVPPRPARLSCDTRAAVKRRLSVFIMRSAPRTLKSAILSLFTATRVAIHRQLKPALKHNPAQTYQRRHTLQ